MKFENTEVWGFEHAIRGMRMPKQSHDRSDSCVMGLCSSNYDKEGNLKEEWVKEPCSYDACGHNCEITRKFVIGEKDLELMQKLIRAGSEHRKFMRQIFVSVDITAPIFWWKEFDTYKVGTVANSTSTMHKLASTPITMDCFECPELMFTTTIRDLEIIRNRFLQTKDKNYWKKLIVNLPESWLQTRTVTMNYENILSMVHQRENHKLNEWSGKDNELVPNFMGWVSSLPYARELLLNGCEVQ